MSLTEQDIRAIVKDELLNLFSKFFGFNKQPDIKYVNTKQAAKELGYSSSRPLYSLINNEVFRLGKEYQDRRPDGSCKADYWFNISACHKRLNQRPEKRAK